MESLSFFLISIFCKELLSYEKIMKIFDNIALLEDHSSKRGMFDFFCLNIYSNQKDMLASAIWQY